jgi:ribonuclease P protein component
MLPKQLRFTKQDFVGTRPKVFFRGTFCDAAFVSLPTTKYTCIISKKTLKRAVDRNRARRRLMSIVAQYSKSTQSNKSVILYPKKELPTAPHPQLQDEIKKLFDTLH